MGKLGSQRAGKDRRGAGAAGTATSAGAERSRGQPLLRALPGLSSVQSRAQRSVPSPGLCWRRRSPGTAGPVLQGRDGFPGTARMAMPAPSFHRPSCRKEPAALSFRGIDFSGTQWHPGVPAEGEEPHIPSGQARRLVQLLCHPRYAHPPWA